MCASPAAANPAAGPKDPGRTTPLTQRRLLSRPSLPQRSCLAFACLALQLSCCPLAAPAPARHNMLRVDRHGLAPPAPRQLEYILTNSRGGFSFSTVTGVNARRYHGLLIANPESTGERAASDTNVLSGERMHLLSCMTAHLEVGGASFELGGNVQTSFERFPVPSFVYEAGGVEIQRRVHLVHGENTVLVAYKVLSAPKDAKIELLVEPWMSHRCYHDVRLGSAAPPDGSVERFEGGYTYRSAPRGSVIHVSYPSCALEDCSRAVREEDYAQEVHEFDEVVRETVFSCGRMRFSMPTDGTSVCVAASTTRRSVGDAEALFVEEERRQQELLGLRKRALRERANGGRVDDDTLVDLLVIACDSFIFKRPDGLLSVIAGYPWFTDWGRDTMIALPGLTLCTGRPDATRSILQTFVKHVSDGMIPNLFPGLGTAPVYNTVDAPLWLFFAAQEYITHTGDRDFIIKDVYPALSSIVEFYRKGTRFGIRMDEEDGLISAGAEGHALTWMDAKSGDWVATPRRGKPVEIQALWYHALKVLEGLSGQAGDSKQKEECSELAGRVLASFEAKFWNSVEGCLHDVVDVDGNKGKCDASIRPNQIFVLSLAPELLSEENAASALERVKEHLLTPYGLRSLAPKDPEYHGIYRGNMRKRDEAYHQGTVWSWLIGHYVDGLFNVKGDSEATRQEGVDTIKGLKAHVTAEAALGTCTEVFDGDAPHLPRACLSQAWSVAELLRVITEYGLF